MLQHKNKRKKKIHRDLKVSSKCHVLYPFHFRVRYFAYHVYPNEYCTLSLALFSYRFFFIFLVWKIPIIFNDFLLCLLLAFCVRLTPNIAIFMLYNEWMELVRILLLYFFFIISIFFCVCCCCC